MDVLRRARLAAVTVVAVAVLLTLVFAAQAASTETSLTVGAIYVGSVKDAGYNQSQHDAVMEMKSRIKGVKVLETENIPETSNVESVMDKMINQGAELIFPTSFGYMDFALKVAKKNKDVVFEHAGGYKLASNFGTYWATASPVSYALGVAAGKTTKTGKLGFVGAIPIPDVIGAADAFHLGAQSVNPSVKTIVIFTGSWSDPAKEASAVNTLANQKVDVVGGVVDSLITVTKTAEQRGVFVAGYWSAAAKQYAPKYWLSGADFDWAPIITTFARQVINDTWKSKAVKPPAQAKIVQLAPFGPKVPAAAKAAATKVMREFTTGKRTSAFVGPIYDQKGKLRVPKGKAPPAGGPFEQTITWLAKGMIGRTK